MGAPALISAAASILGGLLGRSKKITAGDNAYSHVDGIMRASAQFGFNPLTLLGAVSPMGGTPADNSSFGQGIANAGMIASDAMSAKQAQKAKLEKMNQTQTRLQNRLDAITIRTPRPGVYGRARIPADPEVYGGQTARVDDRNPVPNGPVGGTPDDLGIRSSSDDASKVPVRDLQFGGVPLPPQSGTSDSEAIGSRYGEDFASPAWFAGWGAFGYDVGKAAFDAGRDAASRKWKAGLIEGYSKPKQYAGRSGYGMPRRTATAMGLK